MIIIADHLMGMCAIAGFLNISEFRSDSYELLKRMAEAQAHRGPDGEGFFQSPQVGLAHRRLTIVGGESGAQPLWNEDRSVVAIANAEFFDFREKRSWLRSRGHQFSTASDCEILVHLWEEFGVKMVDHLKGQFAFAIWDVKKRSLFLARDRVGICPLHWASHGGRFYFSSEIKGLVSSGELPVAPDHRGIDHVFSFMGLPTERTCYEGISSLLPGHSILLKAGGVSSVEPVCYWDFDFPDRGEEYDPGPARVVDEFGTVLEKAVASRMSADVPVGSYLSGGIDSSILLALARSENPQSDFDSFTISIPSPGLDEASDAAKVASITDSNFNVLKCGERVIGEAYPDLVHACDSPVMDTSSAALGCLAGAVKRKGYKVVISGEGADEALAGYSWFKVNRLVSLCDRGEFQPSNMLRRLVGKIQGRAISWEEARAYQDQIGGAHAMADVFGLLRRGRATFYSDEMWDRLGDHSPYDDIQIDTAKIKRWSPLNQSLYFGYKTLLSGLLLNHKGDRPAMNQSLEVRYPFLDEDFIAYCSGLHPRWKLRGMTRDKHVLRKLGVRLKLPSSITGRRKHVFRAPFAETFFRTPPDYVQELFSEESLRRTGYFSTKQIRTHLEAYQKQSSTEKRSRPIEMALTTAMATQLWHHQNFPESLCSIPKLSGPSSRTKSEPVEESVFLSCEKR